LPHLASGNGENGPAWLARPMPYGDPKMSKKTLKLIKDNEVRWVDLRFTDTHGKEQHVTVPSKEVTRRLL
jgi:hypothetical protein